VTTIYPHEQHEMIESAAVELFDYVDAHLASRLQAPRGDLLSELVTSWQADQSISFDSPIFQVIGMIIGGSDTTRAAFAKLVALLLQHRQAWEALKADGTLIPGAISEAMRFDPSVGSIPRITTEPVEISGAHLPAGTAMILSTLSALRDPVLYPDPDRFDIHREHPRLHPVGSGPHRCIGEMLARLEMEEGLSALIAGAPDIEMESPPRMIGFGGIRQITPMPVRIR
jgi:cytochrome P450